MRRAASTRSRSSDLHRSRGVQAFGGLCAMALASCNEAVPEASFVAPAYGDPCLYAACGHGACVAAGGAPQCVCEPGYTGAACNVCALGAHADSRGLCVPDRLCGEHGDNICGAHGVCNDERGVVACDCDRGYAGARCELCASGYTKDDHSDCLQVYVVAGTVQAPRSSCRAETCNHHGDCTERDGELSCRCYPSYSGARCDLCAAGFVLRGDRCVIDTPCSASSRCGACEGFQTGADFPLYPDTCSAAAGFESADVVMSSMQSLGDVWLCGAGTRYGLASEHVVLEVSAAHPATLAFRTAIRTLSFSIAAGVFNTPGALSLEVTGDGKRVTTLELNPNVSEPIDLAFDPPAREIALRSLRSRNEVALDALVYELAECP
jgi:hypothetical protein